MFVKERLNEHRTRYDGSNTQGKNPLNEREGNRHIIFGLEKYFAVPINFRVSNENPQTYAQTTREM